MAAGFKQSLEEWKTKLDEALHEKNRVNDVLEKIESKTGVKRLHIALGFIALISIYLMIGYGSDFLCNFIGFMYPAYASFKAIETKQKDDDTKWLTYWVVYAVFSLVEYFMDIFLFWIPLYWFLKCVFLMYLMAPTSWNGSVTIYYKIIRPLALRHEKKIDSGLDRAVDAGRTIFDEAKSTTNEAVSDVLKKRLDASKLE
jgi:receptor expression-enhancing protein 5/6